MELQMRAEATDARERRIEKTRDFLRGYRLCLDMLQLRRYERKRVREIQEEFSCEDLLAGSEAYWRARMFEINTLLSQMKNGREKMLLYYHYVRGESIEHAASILGFSRRTGYRVHEKGLLSASYVLERLKKREGIAFFAE